MTRGFLGLVLSLAVSAVVVCGCGGSSDEASSSMTKAEFVKKGNAICVAAMKEKARLLKAAFAIQEKSNAPVTEGEGEKLVIRVAAPPIAAMIDGLSGLTPPAGQEQTVEALVKSLEKGLENLEAHSAGALKADPFLQANKLASAYGLQACGEL